MSKSVKRIVPAAAVSLALVAPNAVGAVELSEVNENFSGVVNWTEDEWNTYLQENIGDGTTLDDYNDIQDLQTDLGPIVNIEDLADGEFTDENVLELITEQGMTPAELASFLETYDGAENIHFLGDLERALADETVVSEEEPIESPADEEVVVDPADPVEENAAEEPVEESVDETGIDMTLVEENYLSPLGWTEAEFDSYLMEEHDMGLNDFADYEELEATVGPVLTDTALSDLFAEYGVNRAEFDAYLTENELGDEEFDFVSEVEPVVADVAALEAGEDVATDTEEDNAEEVVTETEDGGELPNTATSSIENILYGAGALVLGALSFIAARRPKGEQ